MRDRLFAHEPAGESARLTRGWMEMVNVYASRFGIARKPHVARASAELAAEHFEAAYDLRLQAFALVDAAYAELALGDYAQALELANKGRELGARLGVGFVALYGGGLAASALGRLGRMQEARALAREVADKSAARKDRINVGFTLHLLAVTELLAGDAEKAFALARSAVEEPGLVPPTLAYAHATCARSAARLGDAAEALRRAELAIELMNQTSTNDLAEGWINLAHVEALAASGKADDARAAAMRAKARLDERSEGMSDTQRTSFFAIPEHAATRAL